MKRSSRPRTGTVYCAVGNLGLYTHMPINIHKVYTAVEVSESLDEITVVARRMKLVAAGRRGVFVISGFVFDGFCTVYTAGTAINSVCAYNNTTYRKDFMG